METFIARDNDGNPLLPVVHSSFVLKDAVNQFKFFVSDDANLLDAKLVSSLFFVIYFSWFVAFLFIVIFGTVVLVVRVERTFHFIFLCKQIMMLRFKDGHYSSIARPLISMTVGSTLAILMSRQGGAGLTTTQIALKWYVIFSLPSVKLFLCFYCIFYKLQLFM